MQVAKELIDKFVRSSIRKLPTAGRKACIRTKTERETRHSALVAWDRRSHVLHAAHHRVDDQLRSRAADFIGSKPARTFDAIVQLMQALWRRYVLEINERYRRTGMRRKGRDSACPIFDGVWASLMSCAFERNAMPGVS